jgi:hypothetical protein
MYFCAQRRKWFPHPVSHFLDSLIQHTLAKITYMYNLDFFRPKTRRPFLISTGWRVDGMVVVAIRRYQTNSAGWRFPYFITPPVSFPCPFFLFYFIYICIYVSCILIEFFFFYGLCVFLFFLYIFIWLHGLK